MTKKDEIDGGKVATVNVQTAGTRGRGEEGGEKVEEDSGKGGKGKKRQGRGEGKGRKSGGKSEGMSGRNGKERRKVPRMISDEETKEGEANLRRESLTTETEETEVTGASAPIRGAELKKGAVENPKGTVSSTSMELDLIDPAASPTRYNAVDNERLRDTKWGKKKKKRSKDVEKENAGNDQVPLDKIIKQTTGWVKYFTT